MLFDFSSSSSVDARLRRDGVELFNTLWGRLTPGCVPPQGVSGRTTHKGNVIQPVTTANERITDKKQSTEQKDCL